MYDAIIVGGRCAGSATALRLAEAGARVLVVDHRPPSSGHVPSHGNVVAPGALLLREWGLLDRAVAGGCRPVFTTRVHVGTGSFDVPAARPGGVEAMYVSDRSVLDPIVAEAAAAAGAEMRFDVRVTGLEWEDGRVVGIVGQDADGGAFAARARLVVGADGKHSFVARSVGARSYRVRPSGVCAFWSIWSGTGHDAIEFFPGDARMCLVFPLDGDRAWVIGARPVGEWDRYRADAEAEYLGQLGAVPPLAAALEGATRETRLAGSAAFDGFFREAAGPGWALVGDAGHTKDPGPGRGISDAFVQAVLLSRSVGDALAGTGDWDEALAGYAHERDDWSTEIYDLTQDIADAPDAVAALELQLQLQEAEDRQLRRLLVLLDSERAPVAVA